MPTLLVNAKMNPELAARVEASVTGRKRARGASTVRRVIAIARVVVIVVLAITLYVGFTTHRRVHRDLEQKRSVLLARLAKETAGVTAKDRAGLDRAAGWAARLSEAYEGDLVSPEVRGDALAATLMRPAVYLRGPIDSVRARDRLVVSAAVSGKDSLLYCLVDPPPAKTEAAMLDKVRFVHAGGAPLEDKTSNVRRLNDAIVGLPLLQPEWTERARSAEDATEIAKLARELERAPLERAKAALRAEILIVGLDEKGDGTGPTELDGERPHDIRVAVVDLAASKPLLRIRRHVDPDWISVARRPTFASGLDSCALAADIHRAVR